ncbi:MAG: dethiobiotin synthase [Muribaculaceae bacterium]|nr:dethiobiotin synthase [Muribaculaceae bacterium]
MKHYPVIFVSGIDTDAGKTYATAWLVQHLAAQGVRTITQKFIQTGCEGCSEDIEAHRRLCGIGLLPEDLDGTTAPIIFTYPASAQLAARIDGREIDLTLADAATARLRSLYDCVLVEGAGGLMVPVTDDFMAIDYVATRRLPVVLVTNGRLGSINHTVLSLEAIAARGIELAAVVYNHYFDADPVIAADTRAFIGRYTARHFPSASVLDLPAL